MGGLGLALTDDVAWSAGIEGGYWRVRGTRDRYLDHFTFAALLRYRPPELRRR